MDAHREVSVGLIVAQVVEGSTAILFSNGREAIARLRELRTGDLVFQLDESRILTQRSQPGIKARRIDPGGAIVQRLVEGGERLVFVAERRMNGRKMGVIDLTFLRQLFQFHEDPRVRATWPVCA